MSTGLQLIAVVVIGVAKGVATPLGAVAALCAAMALASLAVVVDARGIHRALLIAGLAALAAARGAHARDAALQSPLAAWFDQAAGGDERLESAVDVRGTLAADAAPAEGGARLVIDVDAIRAGREWRAVAGRIQAHVGGALSGHALGDWTAGRGVVAPTSLRRPPLSLNFGGPSREWQQLRRGFDLSGSIKSASLVDVTRGGPLAEAAAAVRARVRRTVAGGFGAARASSGGVVTAILIGDRAGLDDDVERRLQAAGTYHVIAISGGNVALLTAVSLLCLRLLIRSFRVAAGLTAVVVLIYGSVVGGDPSVTRAVTVAVIVLGAEVMGVSATPLHVLGVAAAGILLADPLTAIDVGAWLSFGATLGILLLAHRLIPWVSRRDDGWRRRAVRTAAALLAACLLYTSPSPRDS